MKFTFDSISQMTENEAREFLENLRWPDGPVCPHCGHEKAYEIKGKSTSKKPARPGLYKCADCRKQFTVKVGTIFESSRVPLRKWIMAYFLVNSSKKGISAHQLHRMLGVTYKTAWFMAHRIRESMLKEPVNSLLEGVVEVDETYIGGKEKNKHASKRKKGSQGGATKTPVVAMVERGGELRAAKMIGVSSKNIPTYMLQNIHHDAQIMSDKSGVYAQSNVHFLSHETIDHSKKEYVRGNVHVNSLEGWFSILKRGITGTFHHVSEQHLDRYVTEFAFRYNWRKMDDAHRTIKALQGVEGKRLYYRQPVSNQKDVKTLL